jgi:hypothetical protein
MRRAVKVEISGSVREHDVRIERRWTSGFTRQRGEFSDLDARRPMRDPLRQVAESTGIREIDADTAVLLILHPSIAGMNAASDSRQPPLNYG